MKSMVDRSLALAIRSEPKAAEADLSAFELTTGLLQCLPGTIARKFEAVPVGLQAGTLWIAVGKGTSAAARVQLRALLKRPVRFFLVAREPLRVLLTRWYGTDSG